MKKKKFFIIIFAQFLFCSLLFFNGYRLSSISAAKNIRFTQSVQQNFILKENISEKLEFYVLDIGDSYYTVYSRKYGPLWKAYLGVGSNKKKEENKNIELITKFWLDDVKIGWLISFSHDKRVTHIEVTYGDLIIDQEVIYGQPTIVVVPAAASVPFSKMDVGFNAIALSKDDIPLYELCYPMRDQTIYTEEYGWYPV